MIFLKKRTLWAGAFCFCAGIGLSLLLTGLFAAPHRPVFAAAGGAPVVWIIDPGHGGEDGGAVSPDGIAESGINLDVSLRLNELLRLTGQQTLMTRREDLSVCDDGLSTIRARKASDIRNRTALVNETPNGVLVSIHQNSLPSSPETHGAQAFWNNTQGGETLASFVQDTLNSAINTERPKHPRQIPKTVYLMNHIAAPAVLVECGFLSNAAETTQLTNPDYQTKLAVAITAGCLCATAGEDQP